MPQYIISFPGAAMQLSPEDFKQAGIDANAVVEELKEAGVLIASGGQTALRFVCGGRP